MQAVRTFDSSHEDAECSPYLHGHHFTVTAKSDRPDIGIRLDGIVAELHLRQLDRMLNGGSQTIYGLAAWFMERLLTSDTTVDSVTVEFLGKGATVKRERR